jgi:undecaprenyl-diphosphatase
MHRDEPLDTIFVALSQLGKAGAIWLLVAGALSIGGRRLWPLVPVAAAVLLAELVTTGLKLLSRRPRPFVTEPDPAPLVGTHLDLTLPSGHAATSFAGALVLAVAIRRGWATALLVALAAGVALSRVYVGVHYPSDVLAGAFVGIAAGAAVLALEPAAGPRLRALRMPGAGRRRSRRAQPPG